MHWGRVFYSRGFVCAAVGCILALAFAPSAQAATPSAVDQYLAQQPGAGGTQGGTGAQGVAGEQGQGGTVAGNAGGEAQSGGTGGTLPFTGYPMSAVVWVVLAFVIAGVAMRWGVPALQRLRRADPRAS